MPGIGISVSPFIGTGGVFYDADAQLYFDQLTGSPSASFKSAVNTFVLSLKAANNWTKLDRLWIHAAEIQQNARISVVNPTSTAITEVNSPTWTAGQGYTGNASNMYLKTNYIPSIDGINYSLNNASAGIYTRLTGVPNSYVMGVNGAGVNDRLLMGLNATTDFRINALNPINAAYTDTSGFFVVNRPNASNIEAYRNGVLLGSSAIASQSIPSNEVYILCFNNNGSPLSFTSNQISMTMIGGDNLDLAALNTSVQNLKTALGF